MSLEPTNHRKIDDVRNAQSPSGDGGPFRIPLPSTHTGHSTLKQSEIAKLLGLKDNDPDIAQKLHRFVAVCKSRFNSRDFSQVGDEGKELNRMWLSAYKKLSFLDLGMFSFQNANEQDQKDLEYLYKKSLTFVNIDAEIKEKIKFALECQKKGIQLFDDEPKMLSACQQQLQQQENQQDGNSAIVGFVSNRELCLLNELFKYRQEFEADWQNPRKSLKLGSSGLIWKWHEIRARWEPAIANSRYTHSSILNLSATYLKSCLVPDRLPMGSRTSAERKTILEQALKTKIPPWKPEMSESAFLERLYKEYPPPIGKEFLPI